VTWDPELVGEMLGLVRDLKGEGMMMIVATHEMSFAREVADEVCFPHDGAIVERCPGKRMFTAPEQPETPRFLRRLLDAHRM
jgi:polar amino acid transport system ATP-binding protein